MLNARVKVNTTQKQMALAIARQTADELNQRIKRVVPKLLAQLKEFIRHAIWADRTFVELTASFGSLRAELGISDALSAALQSFPDYVAGLTEIKMKPYVATATGGIRGGILSVRAVPTNRNTLLAGYPYTDYVSDPSGRTIPFMRWLLDPSNLGRVLIRDYRVSFSIGKAAQIFSRSHRALMLAKRGEGYSLPSWVFENGEDFISRAIHNNAYPRFEGLMRKLLT